jgi:hypothetical protein
MGNKRYLIKKTTEPMRGQRGKLDVWYVYDSKEKRICTASSPFKPDIEKMCNFLEEKESEALVGAILRDMGVRG